VFAKGWALMPQWGMQTTAWGDARWMQGERLQDIVQ
jgi:hypothetical protein